jgi:hypothetical protein
MEVWNITLGSLTILLVIFRLWITLPNFSKFKIETEIIFVPLVDMLKFESAYNASSLPRQLRVIKLQ